MGYIAPHSDEIIVKLTSKGQVFLSKAVREKAGMALGGSVGIRDNGNGEVVIRAVPAPTESPEEKVARVRAAIEAVRGKYSVGMSTDEYMRMIRGDYQP
jgi:antitoxin PrlF